MNVLAMNESQRNDYVLELLERGPGGETALPLPTMNSYRGLGEVEQVGNDSEALPLPSWPGPAQSSARTPRPSPRMSAKVTENGEEQALPLPTFNGYSEQPVQDGEGEGKIRSCATGQEEALPLPNWEWRPDEVEDEI